MLIIGKWFGRTGNNIIQIIKCVYYAKQKNYFKIKFPDHPLIKGNKIILKNKFNKEENNKTIVNNFFYLKELNIEDPEPHLMKKIFQKYIKPIFLIKINNKIINQDKTLCIHFRGGDIFKNPHRFYVQPPLSYYKNIIKNYKNIKLICEDKRNPCINELLKIPNTEYISQTVEKDLTILANCKNLVIGFGTFGYLLYLINPNLKNLYIPKFFVEELPKGKWGDDLKVHIVDIPNYIKVGNWKFNEEQKKLMLTYK